MGNEEGIQRYSFTTKTKLNAEFFFKEILVCYYKQNYLNDIDVNRLYDERIILLKTQLEYYTKNESSSVIVEVAEKILSSIDYTIGIYLKSLFDTDLILHCLKFENLYDIFKKGQSLINKKVLKCKYALNKIQSEKFQINNYSYNDTIDKGIDLFFKEYDLYFASHESPGSIDYQLCIDDMNLVGIEYIENYLEILNLENEFCNFFYIEDIKNLLNGYDKKSELLLINVFELVLINSIGLSICSKPIKNLDINENDRILIKNKLDKLSLEQLKNVLLENSRKCCEVLGINNKGLINYVDKAAIKITSYINNSIKINKLEKVFISFCKKSSYDHIEYIDGEKMTNSKFRKITNQIRECNEVEEKIKIIKGSITSFEDLVDMLESECLFEKEYIHYFKSMSEIEMMLLYKYVEDDDSNKEWCGYYRKFLSNLTSTEKGKVEMMSKKFLM